MKIKSYVMASLIILVLLTTNFSAMTPFMSIITPESRIATRAEAVFISGNVPTPFGMQTIMLYPTTDVWGQALYLRVKGTLDGYSLAEAQKIRVLIPVGTRPECECNNPTIEWKARWIGGANCIDCWDSTFGGGACAN